MCLHRVWDKQGGVLMHALRLVSNGSPSSSSLIQEAHRPFQFYGNSKFRCAHQIKCPRCVPEPAAKGQSWWHDQRVSEPGHTLTAGVAPTPLWRLQDGVTYDRVTGHFRTVWQQTSKSNFLRNPWLQLSFVFKRSTQSIHVLKGGKFCHIR